MMRKINNDRERTASICEKYQFSSSKGKCLLPQEFSQDLAISIEILARFSSFPSTSISERIWRGFAIPGLRELRLILCIYSITRWPLCILTLGTFPFIEFWQPLRANFRNILSSVTYWVWILLPIGSRRTIIF